MSHIFLLSDLGTGSSSISRIKGKILSGSSGVAFVDISHEVKNYEVMEAGMLLRDVIDSLPQMSIVISFVSCYYDDPADYILVDTGAHYLMAPNNGVLSFAVPESAYKVYYLGNSDYGNWPGKTFAEAAVRLLNGETPETFAKAYDDFRKFISLKPIINESSIRATIMKADNFGNLILNVDRKTFEEARSGRRFSLHYQHNNPITFISNQYAEVEVGDVLARFNSNGYLEIAVNQSSALDELNLKGNDLIQIDFY